MANDTRTTPDIILEIIPMMSEFYEKELNFRNQLKVSLVFIVILMRISFLGMWAKKLGSLK